MASNLSLLGKFCNGLEALHAANRGGFTIAGLQHFNRLLLGDGREFIGTINDQRCFTGTACLQEKKGKPFGNFVETETSINGEKKRVIVRVRKDLVGLPDRILLFRQGLLEGEELLPLQGRHGGALESPAGAEEIFVNPRVAPKAIFARRRYGLDFFIEGEKLRLFTGDDAAFGLTVRGYDFCNRRGVIAGVPSDNGEFAVFIMRLPH